MSVKGGQQAIKIISKEGGGDFRGPRSASAIESAQEALQATFSPSNIEFLVRLGVGIVEGVECFWFVHWNLFFQGLARQEARSSRASLLTASLFVTGFWLSQGCSKGLVKDSRKSTVHARPADSTRMDKENKSSPGTCQKPYLHERSWIDLKSASVGESGLSRKKIATSSSLRLPAPGMPPSAARSELPGQRNRLFSSSITNGPEWIASCNLIQPRALLRDVHFSRHSFPLDFDQMGRNIDQLLAVCGATIDWRPGGKEKRRIIRHKISNKGALCELEVSGYSDPTRENPSSDHQFHIMHSREVGGKLDYQLLTYRVPEQDWPYLKDVVRRSAESFRPIW